MNSSATTTTLSFLAAAALGAAMFMGCTITSSTTDDTDGGTRINDTDKDKDKDKDTPEAGAPEGGGEACESPQKTPFEPAACQSCMESNCCLELKNCFNIGEDTANGKLGCDGFRECIDDCDKPNDDGTEKTDKQKTTCYQELCSDLIAADGVVTAWQSILACTEQSCKTDCSPE